MESTATIAPAVKLSLPGRTAWVVDTFAEAFPMTATRLIVTAANRHWAQVAGRVFCGYATSVINCDLEADVERELDASETPDGRPGISLLAFAFSRDKLTEAVGNRVGQCLLTCPTSACYGGLEGEPDRRIPLGSRLRYFGDGYQTSKLIGGKRYWRIPVMDGEFICEESVGTTKGVAGGNLLICGRTQLGTLHAAEVASAAMRTVPGIALPFPGGVVRSGSKIGSRYKGLKASTNDAYCPTLRPIVSSQLPAGAQAVYEIVIDGLTAEAVRSAMHAGLHAAAAVEDIVEITAGNYGGKLGPYQFPLRELLA